MEVSLYLYFMAFFVFVSLYLYHCVCTTVFDEGTMEVMGQVLLVSWSRGVLLPQIRPGAI